MSRAPRGRKPAQDAEDAEAVQQVLAAGRAEGDHDVPPAHDTPVGPGHAPGHRHLGPPPEVAPPHSAEPGRPHDQPWVPKGGLVGRSRRSQRRG